MHNRGGLIDDPARRAAIDGNQTLPVGWDQRYEWRTVTLLAFGFGLVGLDRFVILPLFPAMAHDLHLDYQDLGNISAILGIAWGVSSIFTGRLSDRIGRRRVLLPSILLFSLLAGVTGLATGIGSLLLVRAVMGVAEGGFVPTSIAATVEASRPDRIGFNVGLQQNVFPILGLGLGPIIATQLLLVLPSWRWVFVVVCLPGFIVAYLLHRTLRETAPGVLLRGSLGPRDPSTPVAPLRTASGPWRNVFRYRNVPLNMLGMFCMLTCLFVTSVMVPNYLVDVLHLSIQQMGFVMSAIGFGGFAGQFVMPGLSDRLGRKPVILLCYGGAAVFMLGLINVGAVPPVLFAMLFGVAFFNFSLTCLTVGPITSESVPPSMISTATGLTIGAGEIFGGGVAPALAGFIARTYGIQHTLQLAFCGLVLGAIISLGLRETVGARVAVAARFPPEPLAS